MVEGNRDTDSSVTANTDSVTTKKDHSTNWIAIGALIVSIIGCGFTIYGSLSQNKRIENIAFKTQAAENRPLLRVVGKPGVVKVEYTSTMKVLGRKVLMDTVKTKLRIETSIRVRNEGNSIAQIIFYAAANHQSGEPFMRI
jgi:hypothetical protein